MLSPWNIEWCGSIECGVSFSGDIQTSPGCGPVQPALGDPAWAGGWAGGSPEGPASPCQAGILCDSVTWNLNREVRWHYSIMLPPRRGSSVWHTHLGLNLFSPSSVLYRYTSLEKSPAPKSTRWDSTSKAALATEVCGRSFGKIPWLLPGPQSMNHWINTVPHTSGILW